MYLLDNNNFIYIYVFFILRNLFLERKLNYILKDKKYICYNVKNYENEISHRENSNKSNVKICLYFLSSTFIETITHLITIKLYNFNDTNIVNNLIYFIPISFIYEVIFDLFHYIAHKIEHDNVLLYKYIHKVHHTFRYSTTFVTYYHHPIDLILSNTLPQLLTLMIIPKISFFIYNLIIIYKIFIEISGHSGKKINSQSFPQFIFLPKFLKIEMYTEDHDAHHYLNNCNYSKRFTLWDKFFNTYDENYQHK